MNGQYEATVQRIYNYADSNKVYILTGMPHIKMFQPGDKLPPDVKSFKGSDIKYATYNSVLLFAPGDRTVQQYGKIKLVPFGERTPYIDQLPFLGNILQWGVGLSSWNVGQETKVFSANVKTSTGEREVKFGALVCFESVFPNFVTEFSQKGAEFFAVVTNDSWYGNTSGPYQHKEFSALRALENHRAFVRAANGGISCLIDQTGSTKKATRMYETAVITVDVPLLKKSTLFMNSAFVVPYLTILLSVITILLWIYSVIIEKKNKTEKRG
jgi:apolipoprotein N-acyltransferase